MHKCWGLISSIQFYPTGINSVASGISISATVQNMMTSPKLKELYESNMNFSTSHQGVGSWHWNIPGCTLIAKNILNGYETSFAS